MPSPPLLLQPAALEPGRTVVDALYYDMDGELRHARAYPHTYPALVLEATQHKLLVFYISDGLIPDDDDEAWSIGEVPIQHAVLASESVRQRCFSSQTKAGRMTQRLVDHWTNDWQGPEAFVRAVRAHGADAVLTQLKQKLAGEPSTHL